MVPEEERAHGTISAKTYLLFFKEGVKHHFVTVALLLFFLSAEVCMYPDTCCLNFNYNFLYLQGCIVCADWWLANW